MELNIEKLSDLVMQILVLVLPYFAVLVGRWIDAKYKIARGQLSEQQLYALDLVITSAVSAAKQIYTDADGASKKRYVLDIVQSYISRSGLIIDVALLNAKIEAAVFNMKSDSVLLNVSQLAQGK